MENDLDKIFHDIRDVIDQIYSQIDTIKEISQITVETIRKGGKILVCGNGGSAAESQHFAAEIVGRYLRERKGYPALSLTTDTSILTAVSNDYSFSEVFARQVEAIGKKGDLLFGLSTSGSSENVKRAFESAKVMDIKRIALVGKKGVISDLSDVFISIDAKTPRVQEGHLIVIHLICHYIDEYL